MQKSHVLSISLLLAFLLFTTLVVSDTIAAAHQKFDGSSLVYLDEAPLKFQWNEEGKKLISLSAALSIALLIFQATVYILTHRRKHPITKRLFLIPVFCQSNYVILPISFIKK